MGYHRPAVLHKDDRMVFLKQGCGGQGPARFRAGRSKLLNKRGFRGRIEFPLARKTRYNSPDYRVERDAGGFRLTRSVPKRAIGWATFRAYMGKVARRVTSPLFGMLYRRR